MTIKANTTEAEREEKRKRRYALEAKAYKTTLCTKCGAGPGEICITDTGDPAPMHSVRTRHSAYKPVTP